MNNNSNNMRKSAIIFVSVCAALAFPVVTLAQSAPDTSSSSYSAAGTPPSTSDSASSAAGTPPSTSDSGVSSAAGTPPPTGGSSSSAGTTNVTPPVTPPGGGGGGGSSSGSFVGIPGGYSGSGGFGSVPMATNLQISSCPLLRTGLIIKLGYANNGAEVAKLQAFLKNHEHADVSVTGIYDVKTESAVKAFQTKYLLDVMGPWDATRSSGVSYITTPKKINELACASPLTLSPSELAVINSYKQNILARETSGINPVIGVSAPGNNQTTTVATTAGTSSSPIGQVSDQAANTAAAGNLSLFSRFWNFLKSLFR